MPETILSNAFDAKIHLVYDLLEEGANVLALAGADRRKQLFDFLTGHLAKGASANELTGFLSTNSALASPNTPRIVSGVVASDGVSMAPLMEGVGSVRALVNEALQALSGFIVASSFASPDASTGGPLNGEYTCKKWVWDPMSERWYWEYNYTLMEANGNRLSAEELSNQFIEELKQSANPPTQGELWLLQKIKPTYRLVCSVSRDEAPTA